MLTSIETPLTFSGFHENGLPEFGLMFQQSEVSAVQGGGAGSASHATKPAADWKDSLGRCAQLRRGFRAVGCLGCLGADEHS
jgi:hypothetical protein